MELPLEEAKNHVLVCHEKYEYNEVAGSPVSIDMLPLDTDETYRNVYIVVATNNICNTGMETRDRSRRDRAVATVVHRSTFICIVSRLHALFPCWPCSFCRKQESAAA